MRHFVRALVVLGVILGVGMAPSGLAAKASGDAAGWITLPSMPTAREALAAAAGSDGRIYAIGGGYTTPGAAPTSLSTVEPYDPKSNSWTSVASMPTPRDGLAAARGSDGKIYAIGGETAPYKAVATVEAYDPSTNSWTTVAPMPTPRSGLVAVAAPDGNVYAIGGCSGQACGSDYNFRNTVEAYSPTTNTWRTLAPMPSWRVEAAGAIGGDGRIYVLGGCCNFASVPGSPSAVQLAEAYNTSSNSWATVASLPHGGYGLAAATGGDGHVYTIGGVAYLSSGPSRMSLLSSVDSYSPTSNTWSSAPPLGTARTQLAAVTGMDGRIYAIGGRTGGINGQPAAVLATVEALSTTATPATAVATQSAPCQFVLGFKALHDLIPAIVGGCADSEGHDPANGDALQHTTGGLLVWRKSDNWTAFTDGYRTWVNGPTGLQERLNMQRFPWEANPDNLPLAQ